VPWALAGVLAIQAALSLRLIWYNTAFEDEALYLWAGHMEWAHWLHGAPVQPFQAWFSGAPVLYPPLAALADTVGGLAAARTLSLLLMAGVTCFLWGTARRLVGSRAALVAAATFAALAGTAFLGAFATYDALALFLLTAATWIAVQAAGPGSAGSSGPGRPSARAMVPLGLYFLLAGVLLGLACAVKYAAALFVPLALLVAALAAWREAGRRPAAVAFLGALAGVTVTLAAGLALGGHAYWQGIEVTTLNRQPATSSPFSVFKLSYLWTAFILLLALAAIGMSRRERAVDRWLLAILALAIFVVPAGQARADTTVSLHKHVVFGAWFAAMAAGYVLARISMVDKTRAGLAFVVAIPVLAWTLLMGMPQASALFRVWPNATPVTAQLPRLVAQHPGRYLTSADLYQVLGYYEGGQVPWTRWSSDLHFRVPGMAPGPSSDRMAVQSRYFSLIIIATQPDTVTGTDKAVIADLTRAGGYRLVASAAGFNAWAPEEGS
jgi:4-amino-4-deoxy-L-arabinose transferase-like glycosyltransferase